MSAPEVVALDGDAADGLNAAVFRDRASGASHSCALRHLFLFIGADPNAAWLAGCVATDKKGFIVTGGDCRILSTPLIAAPCARDQHARRVRDRRRARGLDPSGSRRRSAKAPRWWRRSTRARAPASARLISGS